MRGLGIGTALLCASLGAGCSIHPVQQDVTQLKTVTVVSQIRCEARLAIAEKAAALLERSDNPDLLKVAATIRLKPSLLPKGIDRSLPDKARAFYLKYINTAIAYDFTFDILEENAASADVDPIRLISRGSLGAGLNAGGTFTRSNQRHFKFSERFVELLYDPNLAKCGNEYLAPNFAYPISGQIGMYGVLDTFIDLNEFTPLEKSGEGQSVFADTLKFTTVLDASAAPRLVLNPLGNRTGLTDALFTASVKRQDLHQLIVGLSFPDPPKGASGPQNVKRSPALAPSLFGARRPASANSPQEQRALDAVDDQRFRTFLDRFGTTTLR